MMQRRVEADKRVIGSCLLRQLGFGVMLAFMIASVASAGEPPLPEGKKAARVEHVGFEGALAAAGRDATLVVAVFGADWCPPCAELRRDVLETTMFRSASEDMHVVEIDVDASPEVVRACAVRKIPAIIVLSPERRIVSRLVGLHSLKDTLRWLKAARERVEAGSWEGASLSSDSSGPEPDGLIEALGAPDPERRHDAMARLQARGSKGVDPLLEALNSKALGVRVGAGELLRRLLPSAPSVNVWAAGKVRSVETAALRKWWADHPRLTVAVEAAPDPTEVRTIAEALKELSHEQPARCTAAAARLVRMGRGTLPQLRAALASAVEAGDQERIVVLEDIRWALLISDATEKKLHVRRALSRGDSAARQGAARQLGLVGVAALPALRELLSDGDGLVKENAVQALRKVGGVDAVAAMATMLSAPDSNLRMVAAQALGKSKAPAAAKHLIKAVSDPDEVVACTAIAGLEELKAKDADEALTAGLADPRWRVRAASAKTIGKLKISASTDALRKCLEDEDDFVVKNALDALGRIGSPPPSDKIIALSLRLPSLAGKGALLLLKKDDSAATFKTIVEIYDKLDPIHRGPLVDGLGERRNYSQTMDEHWAVLINRALAEKDASLRLSAVTLLHNRSRALAATFLSPILSDASPEVAREGAKLVLGAASWAWGIGSGGGRDKRPFASLPREIASTKGFEKHRATGLARIEELQKELDGIDPKGKAEATADALPDEKVTATSEETELVLVTPVDRWEPELIELPKDLPESTAVGVTEAEVLAAVDSYNKVHAEIPEATRDAADEVVMTDADALADEAEKAKALTKQKRKLRREIKKLNAAEKGYDKVAACFAQHAKWHELLLSMPEAEQATPAAALAFFATGDPIEEASRLAKVFTNLEDEKAKALAKTVKLSVAVPLLLRRLPGEKGRALVAQMAVNPAFYTKILKDSKHASPEVIADLLEPSRVLKALRDGTNSSRGELLQALLDSRKRSPASLFRAGEQSRKVVETLWASDFGPARAAAIFVLAKVDPAAYADEVKAALADEDIWVRRAAMVRVPEVGLKKEAWQELAAASVRDAPVRVAEVAGVLLLTDSVRKASNLDSVLQRFIYADIDVYQYDTHASADARPMNVLPTKPPYLEAARGRLTELDAKGDAKYKGDPVRTDDLRKVLVLILAQHGDFAAIDKELVGWSEKKKPSETLLIGAALSRDEKYLPVIEAAASKAERDYEVRRVLGWLRGMRGKKARDLRRKINRRLRSMRSQGDVF